jgi:hypothetical protein
LGEYFSRPCINQSYNEGVSKSTIIAIITRKIDNQQKSPFEAESLFNKSMICLLKESGTYDIWIYKITATLYESNFRPWRSELQCIYSLTWSSLSVINDRSSAFFLYKKANMRGWQYKNCYPLSHVSEQNVNLVLTNKITAYIHEE